MQFYYDFNKMMVTNPLEGVTHFFINPRMIDGFKQLKLDECCAPDQVKLHEGLPIMILPLRELKLDNGIVKLDDDGRTGNIKAGGLTIYFKKVKLDNKTTLQINTVLGSRRSQYDDIRPITQDEMIKKVIKDIDSIMAW